MCQMWKLSIPRNRRGKKQQKSCQRTFLLDYKAMRINFFPDWAVLQPKYSTFLFSVDTNKLCWKRFHLNWKHTKIAPCAQVVGFVLSVYVSPQILLHPVSALAGSEQSAWVGGRSLEGCPQVPLIEMPIYKPELCFSFFCLFKCFNQTLDLKYYNIAIMHCHLYFCLCQLQAAFYCSPRSLFLHLLLLILCVATQTLLQQRFEVLYFLNFFETFFTIDLYSEHVYGMWDEYRQVHFLLKRLAWQP